MTVLLLIVSNASAAFTPTQLVQALRTPDAYKPSWTQVYVTEDAAIKVQTWGWDGAPDTFYADLVIQRFVDAPDIWRMSFDNDAYALDKLAPQRTPLATVTDFLEGKRTVYLIKSGPFAGAYAGETRREGQVVDLTLMTPAYAVDWTLHQRAEKPTLWLFDATSILYAYLTHREALCQHEDVTCTPQP